MKIMHTFGRMTIIPSILGIAIWLWILNVVGVDVWAAGQIAHFINLVAERIN